jgi:hypothetical protein
MKLKLTIALVVLALVLGMVLTACDDGEVVKIADTQKTVTVSSIEHKVTTDTILDKAFVPYIDGLEKDPPMNGTIKNETDDTTGNDINDILVDLLTP